MASFIIIQASPAQANETVVFDEDFTGVANGSLPTGWTSVEGSWQVTNGELIGVSTSSSQNSRITFTPSISDYRLEMSMRFVSSQSGTRWAGALLDTGSDPLWTMAGIRNASTASNGVEVTERRSSGWNTLEPGAAPTDAGSSVVDVEVEVHGALARVFFNGVQVVASANVVRTGGSIGLVANGSTVAFDDIVITQLTDVIVAEDFDNVANGSLPTGWTSVEGSWQVTNGELIGVSTSSSQNSRITFTPSLSDYRLEMSMRFVSSQSNTRWAGALLDTSGSDPLWTMAGIRKGSTASNGVEVTERRSSGWNTLEKSPAPTDAGSSVVDVKVEVHGALARVFFNGVQVVASANVVRTGGSIGLVANGSTVAFDDVVVTRLSEIVVAEDFDNVANGSLPTGWTSVEGSWQVTNGELIGVSTSSSQNSRITFTPSISDYRLEMSMRFVSSQSGTRWAGALLDTGSDPLWTMAGIRNASTASNGVEVTERNGTTWHTIQPGAAPTDAGSSTVSVMVEVHEGSAKVFFNGVQVVASGSMQRTGGSIGLVVNGSTVAFDDVEVTLLDAIPAASLLRPSGELAYTMAHRGASAVAPENTMPAYELAAEAGAYAIETDVRRTADGAYVMSHNATVDAHSDCSGNIADLTLAQLQGCDFGSWFSSAYAGTHIAEWLDVLDHFRGTGQIILVELKSGSVKEVLDPVIARGMEDQIIFDSFSEAEVSLAQGLAPQIRRAWVQNSFSATPLADAELLGLKMYITGKASVLASGSTISQLRAADVAVTAWTVNDEFTWDQLNALGIDGIVTDEATVYEDYRDQ